MTLTWFLCPFSFDIHLNRYREKMNLTIIPYTRASSPCGYCLLPWQGWELFTSSKSTNETNFMGYCDFNWDRVLHGLTYCDFNWDQLLHGLPYCDFNWDRVLHRLLYCDFNWDRVLHGLLYCDFNWDPVLHGLPYCDFNWDQVLRELLWFQLWNVNVIVKHTYTLCKAHLVGGIWMDFLKVGYCDCLWKVDGWGTSKNMYMCVCVFVCLFVCLFVFFWKKTKLVESCSFQLLVGKLKDFLPL